MEVHHKLKPVHSWRELLSEIGVVVIGVCIALAAEQAVDWLHWRDKVSTARSAIASETATNLSYGIMRMRRAACTEKSLDTLAQTLDAASKSGSLPPVGEFGSARNNVMLSGQWDSLMSSETAAHFPADEVAGLSAIYVYGARYNDRTLQEVDTIAQLDTMAGPGRKLDPESEARLREALSHERLNNRALSNYGVRIWQVVAQRHLKFSKEDFHLIDAAQRQPVSCPVAEIPAAGYGQAPWGSVLDDANEILAHPPQLQAGE